jgi:hypothetical protein
MAQITLLKVSVQLWIYCCNTSNLIGNIKSIIVGNYEQSKQRTV